MKPSREQLFYLVVLLALVLAAVVFWSLDPNRQPAGGSLIPWTAPAQPAR